ncbi:MAG: alpha/beta fold hydrolase BchO [Pseudomonadota bacterium]
MDCHPVEAPDDFADVAATWPLSDKSRFLRCGSINWHVQQLAGDDKAKPVLLIHGTGGSTHSMAPLAKHLQGDYQITLIDLPGHGFTRGEAHRHYTLPGMARALSGLIDALGLNGAIGVGHSAGAAILIQIGLEHREQLSGIIGINAALEPIEGNAIFSPLAKALFVNPFVPSAVAWQARYVKPAKSLLKNTGSPLNKLDVGAYDTLMRKSTHIAGALGMMANWDLKPLRKQLPTMKVPVELIVADDDTMVPARVSRQAVSEAEAVTLHAFPEGGHLVHEFAPGLIAERIAAMAGNLQEVTA